MMALAWPLLRITEQAALAAWPQTGCGDKNKIDGLAVTAMREALNALAMQGRVVIGEGEIDCAPMLYIGEGVGTGAGPAVDIAVDPIEGTRMVAMGQSNALAVMFCATGVTDGDLLKGIHEHRGRLQTQTLLISGAERTCNIIDSLHCW